MIYALLILILIGAVAVAVVLSIISLRLLRVKPRRWRLLAPIAVGGVCIGGMCIHPDAFVPLAAFLVVGSIPFFIVSVVIWCVKRNRGEEDNTPRTP